MDHTVAEPNWEQIEPHLAEVIDQLTETDRTAIVLRFFESRSLKDVARTLEEEGVASFTKSYDELNDVLGAKAAELAG